MSKLNELDLAAHAGAFGFGKINKPSEKQLESGNYSKGKVSLFGISITIEQPKGSYRTGVDKNGKRWTNTMMAHYGYINGTVGADGDQVDVFIGFMVEQESAVYIINQNKADGSFDEHKCMIGFIDEDHARGAYLGSFDRGWTGLGSIHQVSMRAFKNWLKSGDKTKPFGENIMSLDRVKWNQENEPAYYDSSANLITGIPKLLYGLRSQADSDLLKDPVTVAEIYDDSDGIMYMDALVSPFSQLQRKMDVLMRVMNGTSSEVKPVALQITDPFSKNGTANVAAVFELSDGQTISIFFHNPDVTPKKMGPTDEVISWKWSLNKKDITIVVAPEKGVDLNVREVATRILKLAQKNSEAFTRANTKRAERLANIENLNKEIERLEAENKRLEKEYEVAKFEVEERELKKVEQDRADKETLELYAGLYSKAEKEISDMAKGLSSLGSIGKVEALFTKIQQRGDDVTIAESNYKSHARSETAQKQIDEMRAKYRDFWNGTEKAVKEMLEGFANAASTKEEIYPVFALNYLSTNYSDKYFIVAQDTHLNYHTYLKDTQEEMLMLLKRMKKDGRDTILGYGSTNDRPNAKYVLKGLGIKFTEKNSPLGDLLEIGGIYTVDHVKDCEYVGVFAGPSSENYMPKAEFLTSKKEDLSIILGEAIKMLENGKIVKQEPFSAGVDPSLLEEGDNIRFTPNESLFKKGHLVVEGILVTKDLTSGGHYRLTIMTSEESDQGGGNLMRNVYSSDGTIEMLASRLDVSMKQYKEELEKGKAKIKEKLEKMLAIDSLDLAEKAYSNLLNEYEDLYINLSRRISLNKGGIHESAMRAEHSSLSSFYHDEVEKAMDAKIDELKSKQEKGNKTVGESDDIKFLQSVINADVDFNDLAIGERIITIAEMDSEELSDLVMQAVEVYQTKAVEAAKKALEAA